MRACRPTSSMLSFFVRHFASVLFCAAAFVAGAQAAPPAFPTLPERVEVAWSESFELAFGVTDADGDTVLVTVDGMPPWMRATYNDPGFNIVESIALPEAYRFVWDMDSDSAGNLYLAANHITAEGQIVKFDTQGQFTVLASGLGNVANIAVTPDGRVYYAEETGGITDAPFATRIYRLGTNGIGDLLDDDIDRLFEMDANAAGELIMLRVNGPGTVTQILSMTPATGTVRVLAGSDVPQTAGFPNQHEQLVSDGTGAAARFAFGRSLFIGKDGNVFVPDITGRIRRVSPAGVVTTLTLAASSLAREILADSSGRAFFQWDAGLMYVDAAGGTRMIAGDLGDPQTRDGWGTAARFRNIIASVMRPDGSIALADWQTHTATPWQPILRTVKFNARGIMGAPAASDWGAYELTLTARDGTNTVTKKLIVDVTNRLDLNGGTRTDLSLPAGRIVSGGSLGGTISGDATQPALLRNVTVLPDATLQDVIIGAGVSFGSGVRLLENVRFENNAYIPAGLLLDMAIGFGPSPSIPRLLTALRSTDLNGSVLLDPVPLIDELREVAPGLALPGVLSINAEGHLVYRKDDRRWTYHVARVESADVDAANYRAGLFVDPTGTLYAQTPAGRVVYLRPAATSHAELLRTLQSADVSLSVDGAGVYHFRTADQWLPLLPDAVSAPARAGLLPGVHRLPHPQYSQWQFFLHVFNDGTTLREQAYYPTAYNAVAMKSFVDVPPRLLPTGGIDVVWQGQALRLWPGLETRMVPQGTEGFGLKAAGDLNGDKLSDYRMIYRHPAHPNYGAEQLMYGLP